ncbi:hypothetical protein L21SP5_02870 [Salinivirga cyanobacteriivorans]|uniref:Protein BatD n=1 Tax=Salinivirga cyanobacteriivorans TaxID=1307839 RepID=A0A0S2I2P4_9BACT|nr:hypothetical protein [Salinivirga cyanobacteriivorans]ALO16490.1 hypothetical protein L21SP5_02870 [Salinivirga cyanobacteriivorans]
MKQRIFSILLILILKTSLVQGQGARVEASLDTSMMLIGDHVEFALSANVPNDARVSFPPLMDTLVDKIEIIRDLPFDTILEEGRKTVRKPYIITSFDSGSYEIKPYRIAVSYGNNHMDTLRTNPVYLGVTTFNIDSAANAIADIKKPIETPLTFKEFLNEYAIYAGLIIFILALIFTLWWYFKKQQKQKAAIPKKTKPSEPPHVIALRELEELQGKKLWQKDKIKSHYSMLSDIVRKYLEHRFDVPAMENTTGYIELYLKNYNILDTENYKKVSDILEMADLAKFAKFSPLPDDNSRTMDYAYQLVISTKEQIVEPEQENEKESQ